MHLRAEADEGGGEGDRGREVSREEEKRGERRGEEKRGEEKRGEEKRGEEKRGEEKRGEEKRGEERKIEQGKKRSPRRSSNARCHAHNYKGVSSRKTYSLLSASFSVYAQNLVIISLAPAAMSPILLIPDSHRESWGGMELEEWYPNVDRYYCSAPLPPPPPPLLPASHLHPHPLRTAPPPHSTQR